MFSHFAEFIPKFAEKLQTLLRCGFPLSAGAIKTFEELKSDILNAVVSPLDHSSLLTVETDASHFAIAATLSQKGRPIAFFSRSLNKSEQRHSSIEKEAYAIVEALRKWRHYLMGRKFQLITDQRSVSFMFSDQHPGKIKNEKIMLWKLELSCFKYDIIYRPGKENQAADMFSRVCGSIQVNLATLKSLHEGLCHPGNTRMHHYVRSKNLPFSIEEIRKVTSSCRECSEIKPRFHRYEGKLIKATQPFERLNMDFKGPLPSSSRNRYLLIIVDEYSRYPFAFPCHDMTATNVVSKLKELFSLFGTPAYVHTDRGSSFMSQELKTFLNSFGVATSRTTPYNPQGNGQGERYVGTIWKTIQLALRSRNLDISKWEDVIHESLNSIRSLLCTSTNETPHERMFGFARRSSNGYTTPTWLITPGPVLLKRHVRQSKYDPLVEEVQLLEGNPSYSFIRFPDGRETTVSSRHLAPLGFHEDVTDNVNLSINEDFPLPSLQQELKLQERSDFTSSPKRPNVRPEEPNQSNPESSPTNQEQQEHQPQLRRSTRIRQPPSYLQDFST